MDSEVDLFVYEPLKNPLSFRLLKVEPEQDGVFCCTLEEEILPSDLQPMVPPPTYTALSYTWGDHADLEAIICNGKSMMITKKLCEALRGIAPLNTNEYIWADQICINQEDIEEKQQQVDRMTTVYHLAITVLAWLGPERHDTALAVDWIQRIAGPLKGYGNDIFRDYENDDERTKTETTEELTLEQSEELGVSFANEAAWTAFSAFYDSPWYERMWVVQELLPAREAMLVCGSHYVDWHLVKAAAAWYTFKTGLIRKRYDDSRAVDGIRMAYDMNLAWNFCYGAEFLRDELHQTVRPMCKWLLTHLLGTFYYRTATDPRDKIYALLGISDVHWTASRTPLLECDYSKSVRNVYRDTIRGYLQTAMSGADELNIIWFALGGSDETDWPSWVPDFRRREWPGSWSSTLPKDYPAAWRTKLVLHDTDDDDCLALEGMIMGHVIYQSEWDCAGDLYRNMRSSRDELVDFYHEQFGSATYMPDIENSESVETACTMALTAGQLWSGFSDASTSPEDYASFLPDLAEAIYLPRDTSSEIWDREEKLQPFYDRGFSWNNGTERWQKWTFDKYCGRRLFVTDTGYIGLGRKNTQVGDAIGVLWGLSRSCVLRPLKEGDYAFVGEAYCRFADKAVEKLERVEEFRPRGEVVRLR